MAATVYTVRVNKGVHTFYLRAFGQDHYLFSQPYRSEVKAYFGNGVTIDAALDRSRAKRSADVLRVMERLPSHIKYVEKEYGVDVLRQTVRKHTRAKKRAA